MTNRFILAPITFLCFLSAAFSQSPVLQPPLIFNGPASVSTIALLDITLLNYKPGTKYSFEASITYDAACSGGYQTVAFLKLPQVYFTDAGKFEASELPVYDAGWEYTDQEFQNALNQTGFLPPGCYEVCYKLVDFVEYTPIYACTNFKVESQFPFYLLTPFDQSKIDDPFPILSWTPYEGVPGVHYRLSLVEVYTGQSDVEAILSNAYKFSESNQYNTFLQYPLYASPLENCRHYAWQVDVLSSDKVVKSSEVWEFYTPCPDDLDPGVVNAAFHHLGEDADHIPFAIAGDTLRIILMQPYDAIEEYKLVIESLNEFQKHEVELVKIDHKGTGLDSNDLQTGENLCMIELNRLGFIPGNQYLLTAQNQKSAYYLHFQYLKSE